MPKPVHITTPWPTPKEVATRFRISKRRQKELSSIAEEYLSQLGVTVPTSVRPVKKREVKRQNASAAD